MAEEDAPRAKELACGAVRIGHDLNAPDIEAIGLALEGVALVTEGEVSSGMQLLDEAAAAALSGEIADPAYVAWALCYLIYACERVRDYDRAAEWCERMRAYADIAQAALPRGICRVRLAGVLIWLGDWHEAERLLSYAAHGFIPRDGRRAADVTVRLAELRRRQGRLTEAEALFREAAWHPLALVGLAELALEAGNPEDARDLTERLLRQVPAGSLTQRAAAFELRVRVQAQLGDLERAQHALETVRSLAAVADTPPLRASANVCAATLALTEQHYDDAMAYLEDAADLYVRCGAPYEAARTRLELAGLLILLGRLERAKTEADQAHAALELLNAQADADRAATVQQEIRRRLREAATSSAGRGQLTARQLDVLRLIARGLSNREIADALVVSEHTVHRHVANILQRLDLPSRAAAAAYATSHNLI
jgi:ATP/maltotriose-dependent transcriptional regulator MalT